MEQDQIQEDEDEDKEKEEEEEEEDKEEEEEEEERFPQTCLRRFWSRGTVAGRIYGGCATSSRPLRASGSGSTSCPRRGRRSKQTSRSCAPTCTARSSRRVFARIHSFRKASSFHPGEEQKTNEGVAYVLRGRCMMPRIPCLRGIQCSHDILVSSISIFSSSYSYSKTLHPKPRLTTHEAEIYDMASKLPHVVTGRMCGEAGLSSPSSGLIPHPLILDPHPSSLIPPTSAH